MTMFSKGSELSLLARGLRRTAEEIKGSSETEKK